MKTLLIAIIIAVTAAFFTSASVDAQTRNVNKFGYIDFAPTVGFVLPFGTFADVYQPGPKVGLDVTYRVNKEVGIYGSVSYNSLTAKDEVGESVSFISALVGPRYYFSSPKLNSNLFVEGSVGAYMFNKPTYSINNADNTTTGETKIGVSTGIGGLINLSKAMDLSVKGKYNTIFREGGTSSFISADGSLVFRF